MASLTSKDDWFVILAPNRTDLYWRPNRCGYTTSLAQAGVYSAEEAEGIVRLGRGDEKVPLSSLREDLFKEYTRAKDDVIGVERKLELIN